MEDRDWISNPQEPSSGEDGSNNPSTAPREAGGQIDMPEVAAAPEEKVIPEQQVGQEPPVYQPLGAQETNRPAGHLLTPAYTLSDDVQNQKPERAKLKTTAPKVIGLIVVILVILAGVLFSVFDFTISSTGGGLDISIRQRGNDSEGGDSDFYYGDEPDDYQQTDSDGQMTQITPHPTGDGTTLTINSETDQEYSLQEIYEKRLPSIVLINVTFSDGEATGTGIIMSENGYIITNDHVIQGALEATVELYDGTVYDVFLVGEDSQTDLAVLKIDAEDLTPAQFGDSGQMRVGDEVAAIGNPLGLNFTLSNGIVSAINRDVDVNGYSMSMIQTNVAINEGNSGGALINMNGQVVGITNMKLVSNSSYSSIEGMGFAIPTSVVKPVVDSLIANGFVTGRPALGIMCMTLDEETAESEGLPKGVYISSVYEESDAYGKLEEGDVIIAADGIEVFTVGELNEIKNSLDVGGTLTLTIYRDDESFDVDIVLVESGQLN